MRPAKTCHHIKADGKICQSFALKGRRYCYFHIEQRRRSLRRARALGMRLEDGQPTVRLGDMPAFQRLVEHLMNQEFRT